MHKDIIYIYGKLCGSPCKGELTLRDSHAQVLDELPHIPAVTLQKPKL